MKTLYISIIFVSLIFLIIDLLWLSYSVKYFYKPNLGIIVNDKPVIWAAILFYFIYMACLSIIVLKPSLDNNSIFQAFWMGIIFGLACYGTYNLTNMATLKNWSINVVIVDMIWGGLLTGTSSYLGIFLAKKIIN